MIDTLRTLSKIGGASRQGSGRPLENETRTGRPPQGLCARGGGAGSKPAPAASMTEIPGKERDTAPSQGALAPPHSGELSPLKAHRDLQPTVVPMPPKAGRGVLGCPPRPLPSAPLYELVLTSSPESSGAPSSPAGSAGGLKSLPCPHPVCRPNSPGGGPSAPPGNGVSCRLAMQPSWRPWEHCPP